MASYGFHPEATEEYLAATTYYLAHASSLIATAFVAKSKVQFKHFLPLRPDSLKPKNRTYVVVC